MTSENRARPALVPDDQCGRELFGDNGHRFGGTGYVGNRLCLLVTLELLEMSGGLGQQSLVIRDVWVLLGSSRCRRGSRVLVLATGMANIRDVIPFPRTPNNADF